MQFKNYRIQKEIHSGLRSRVFRAVREPDGSSVVIKTHVTDFPNSDDLARFQKECRLLQDIRSPGVIICHELIPCGNGLALIFEALQASPLNTWLQRLRETSSDDNLPELPKFLNIAIQTAEALSAVHLSQIVHSDVRPENILLSENGEIKIIDLGSAQRIPLEAQDTFDDSILKKSLSYISPEQTGRIHRPVDIRSDLYSLGIVFYELLTGRVPFLAKEPAELIYCHLTKKPNTVLEMNASVPPAISDIIMKLMAKDPDDRYRNTAELLFDLQKCSEQLMSGLPLNSSILGAGEHTKFDIAKKLYGHEHVIQRLHRCYARVSNGSELFIISGCAGSGKSSIVHEFRQSILGEQRYFITAECDHLQQHQPYQAFTQIFRELFHTMLMEPEEKLQIWKKKLQDEMGAPNQFIVDIVPEIGTFFRLQGAGPRNRKSFQQLHSVFAKFIELFIFDKPIVIFLDNLQWIDADSLQLIRILTTSATRTGLFLIGAYRENEMKEACKNALREMESDGAKMSRLELLPFEIANVQQLTADVLGRNPRETLSLSRIIHSKTGGTPFFVWRFLEELIRENLLRFDVFAEKISWDLRVIREMRVTENVVATLTGNMRHLTEISRGILVLASCIGNQVDLELLIFLHGKSRQATLTDLEELFRKEILSIRKNYIEDMCHFAHDRIRQAAYESFSEKQRSDLHLKIGRRLVVQAGRQIHDGTLGQEVFDIVNHLNKSLAELEDESEKNLLARLNWVAGKRCQASALKPALRFFMKAIETLEADCWQKQYVLAFDCHFALNEIRYLNGMFSEAQDGIEETLGHLQNLPDRCALHELKIKVCQAQNDYFGALRVGLKSLRKLGLELDLDPDRNILLQELETTQAMLQMASLDALMDLPEMEASDVLAMQGLLVVLWPVCRHIGSHLMYFIAMKIVQLSFQHGCSDSLIIGLACCAHMFLNYMNDGDVACQTGRLALQLQERREAKSLESMFYGIWGGLVAHCRFPIPVCLPWLKRGLQAGLATGNYRWAGYAAVHQLYLTLWGPGGNLKRVIEITEDIIPILKTFDSNLCLHLMGARQLVYNLEQAPADVLSLSGAWVQDEKAVLDFAERSFDLSSCFVICMFKLSLALWYARYERAFELAQLAKKYADSSTGGFLYIVFLCYSSIAICQFIGKCDGIEKENLLSLLDENLSYLERWSHRCPKNYENFYLLAKAESFALQKRYYEAQELYDRAFHNALEFRFQQNAALTAELAARFYMRQNRQHIAYGYCIDASQAYDIWGAAGRLRVLLEELRERNILLPGEFRVEARLSRETASALDLHSVVRMSQAIGDEILLKRLFVKFLHIIVESAGAEKGVLVLNEQESLTVQAEIFPGLSEVRLQSCRLDASPNVSVAVIKYAKRLRGEVVLDDACSENRFVNDPYIVRQKVKSLLCLPLIFRRSLVGLLYLENNMRAGVFTVERLEIIRTLASQAAASIEHALLYASLEEKVHKRTAQLHDANQNLESALEESQQLRQRQDGDYYLMSLLLEPLGGNRSKSETVRVSSFVRQKKEFEFRGRKNELGGDMNIAHSIILQGDFHTVFLNGDAMGKSSQGAGGILVLGSVFSALLERNEISLVERKKSPVVWLKQAYVELQKVFESFESSMFVSMVLGLVADRTGELFFINVEHPHPVLYRDNQASFLVAEKMHCKLGARSAPSADLAIHIERTNLRPGDALLCGSDGRDDIIILDTDTDARGMNTNDGLFLRHVERGEGEPERVYQEILKTGEPVDDISILRVEYTG